MTTLVAPVQDSEDVRWRRWQARGAERARKSAARMRVVALFIAAAVAVWFLVVLG
jgi:hypothetical protein